MSNLVNVDPEQVRGLLAFLTTTVNELEGLVGTAESNLAASEGYWISGSRATMVEYFGQWKTSTATLLEAMRGQAIPEVETWLQNLEQVAHSGLTMG